VQWPTERLRLEAMAAAGDARRFDGVAVASWLPDVVRTADLVVSAVGVPNLIRRDWVRPGAVVLDVGIVPLALVAETNPLPLQVLCPLDVSNPCRSTHSSGEGGVEGKALSNRQCESTRRVFLGLLSQ
jgi:hypothetical protein